MRPWQRTMRRSSRAVIQGARETPAEPVPDLVAPSWGIELTRWDKNRSGGIRAPVVTGYWIASYPAPAGGSIEVDMKQLEVDQKQVARFVRSLTKDHALARAKAADAEIASGKYRGSLHGIPYGVKDLLDTKDIPTTYGAEPFRGRVPKEDSAVVRRLNDAGAVLLAKLSLGASTVSDVICHSIHSGNLPTLI